MAYDKIIPLRARLDHCLDYVLNEEKSSLSYALAYAENPKKSHQLVTGVNCQARQEKEERNKDLAANRESRPDRHFGPVR